MEDETIHNPELTAHTPFVDPRERITDVELPPQIRVDGSLFGIDKWKGMVEESQKDGKERSIFISTDRKGAPVVSKIRESNESVTDVPDVTSEEGIAPHGLRSLIPGILKPFLYH